MNKWDLIQSVVVGALAVMNICLLHENKVLKHKLQAVEKLFAALVKTDFVTFRKLLDKANIDYDIELADKIAEVLKW